MRFFHTYSGSMVALMLMLGISIATQSAAAQTFTDSFEQSSLNAFWSQTGPGTASLSSSNVLSGSQSVKLAASPTFPWVINLLHDFGSDQMGSVSVWVQGQQLCCGSGAGLQLYNAAGDHYALWQQSGNINCNSCFAARATAGGPESDFALTADPTAWHHLEINIGSTGTTFKFDGVIVYQFASLTSFRVVDLTVWGGPGGTAFFDDFSSTTSPVQLYHICPLYDPTKPVKSGSTLPVKLQLCDANGNDVSSALLPLHATSLIHTSAATSGEVQDSGNANPDNDFRFDSSLGPSGGYIFNLSTTGLNTGSYSLNFTITGDSSLYTTPFQVK